MECIIAHQLFNQSFVLYNEIKIKESLGLLLSVNQEYFTLSLLPHYQICLDN